MAAGNIDSLNFEVILNDKQFESSVLKDIQLAKQLNKSLTEILNAKNKINAGSTTAVIDQQRIAREAAKTSQEKAKEALQWQKVRTEAEKTALAQQKVKASIEKSANALTGTGSSMTRMWLRFSATIWSIISAIRLFTRTIGSAIKRISEFQQANANLATIMQVSRKEVEKLTNDALMLGRTTEWTASQVTELQTALAKLGYNIPQIRNMQASVLQFATAVGANLPDAANLAGASLRMFGLHSSEMQKTLEILTASTNKTALDFEKLKVSLPYVGAIAHSIGFDVSDTSALLGVLANSGLAASRTGTGLRKVLLELSKENGKLQAAMGGNVKTFDDFVRGLQLLRDRGLEAGEAQKLVGDRAGAALLILANGVDDVKRLNKEVKDTDGLLKSIQSDRLDTLHGSTLLLKSAWEGLIQTFRDSAGPMKDIVDWLTKIIRATSLAAGRSNRVAQGTKGGFAEMLGRPGFLSKGITGSDTLTKQFEQQFESLLKDGKSAEEAAKVVNDAMQGWLDSSMEALVNEQRKGYKETGWTNFLYNSMIGHVFVGRRMNAGREANEQVEAVENTMDAVHDYIASRSKEEAEIAANEYLDKFTEIFNEKGAKAARDAISSLEKEMTDKGVDVSAIKQKVDAIIENGSIDALDLGNDDKAEDKERKAISDIQTSISLLEKYKSAYDKLEPVYGADAASAWVFNNMGHDVANLDEEFEHLIASLRTLGKEGNDAADSVEARLGLGVVNKLVKAKQEADKAQKALEKYQDTYRKWAGEDFNLGGTGFEYDIRKIFSDYNTKLSGVDEKYIKAVREAEEAHKGDAEAIAEEILKLGELRDAEKEYIKAQSQERINNLAESYLQDQYLLHNINLEHLGGKTVSQLKTLKQGLIEVGNEAKATIANFTYYEGVLASWGMDIENLTDEDLESLKDKLPETEIEMIKLMKVIKSSGLTFDQLGEKIQSALKKGLKDLDDEEKKALAQLAKNAAKQVLSLADSFERLGEATGNAGLAQAAKDIGAIGSTIQSAAEGFKTGGWIGAAIGAFVSITDQIVNAAAIAAEKERELRDAIRDVKVEVMSASFDNVLSNGVDTVFGDNFVKNISNATEGIAKAQERLESLDKWMKQFREDVERHPLAHTGGLLYTLFGGEGAGNTLIQTKHSRWKATDEYATIEHLAEELGYESINDKYGNLNPDLLEDILDLYGDLNEELKDWLVNSAEYSREYAKAMEQIEDATKSVFDKLASDMADKFIDNFMQMGNAVDDLSDTFADLGDAILRSFLQSYILDEILGKYKKMAQDALTKYSTGEMTPEDYAAWLDGFAQNVQEESETLAPAINGMLEAFKDRGLMNIDEDTETSLGSGIKSITEDTANLLASYINAIRADVSYIRSMQERGWESINLLGASVPTLNEYLAQIAATNFDIAQSNQSILSELRSVIGPVGTSGMVVRVEYA